MRKPGLCFTYSKTEYNHHTRSRSILTTNISAYGWRSNMNQLKCAASVPICLTDTELKKYEKILQCSKITIKINEF